MKKLLSGKTTSVRYKDPAFEQIVGQLRQEGLGTQATLLVFTGMSRYPMQSAARTLAMRLGKQLFRVELSGVSGKYIGETEKNLKSLLDKASSSNWILFFDEADALFGKRIGVKDAHDRYANQEVSYLLKKLEKYRGIAILTTQNKSSIDSKWKKMRKVMVRFPPV